MSRWTRCVCVCIFIFLTIPISPFRITRRKNTQRLMDEGTAMKYFHYLFRFPHVTPLDGTYGAPLENRFSIGDKSSTTLKGVL